MPIVPGRRTTQSTLITLLLNVCALVDEWIMYTLFTVYGVYITYCPAWDVAFTM
jgi:hypothetical protein